MKNVIIKALRTPREMGGKAGRSLLREITRYVGRLGRNIAVPPHPSIDAGAERLMGLTRVYATDPALGVPEEDLGYFAFHFSASDVAVLGAEPKLMTSTILLPADADDNTALRIAKGIDWEAYRYGVAVITGHTGRYESVREPIVVTTVIGEVREPVTPKLAKAGDKLLLVGVPGAELMYGVAHFNPTLLEERFGKRSVERWRRARWMLTAVDSARDLVLFSRVNGMKDGAEGGIIRLLNDFADAAELGFTVNGDVIPFPPELLKLSDEMGFDPLAASSSGVVLAAIPSNMPLGFLKDLMESHGFVVRVIGELRKGGRELITKGEIRDFPSPEEAPDPYPDLTRVN